MRPFKKTKPKNPTILQQQSNKLKQKLQMLRQQVTLKKQEKQMSKTATSLQGNKNNSNKFLMENTKNNTQYPTVDIKFQNALAEMKIENIEQKLKEKGIKTHQKLQNLTDDQIDEWKDILVGYRIKLKRYIKSVKSDNQSNRKWEKNKISQILNSQSIEKKIQQSKITSPLTQNVKYQPTQRNIQDIIKQRQKEKVFAAIQRKIQVQQNYDEYDQMAEDDQDVIIQSFMNVFQPRQGILRQKKQNHKNRTKKHCKHVRWSKQVQKMEQQFRLKNHKKYPKQSIAKQALHLQNTEEILSKECISESDFQRDQLKYCWKCFRKIDIRQNINFLVTKELNTNKYFCGQKCWNQYSNQISSFSVNPVEYGNYQNGEFTESREQINQRKQKYGSQQRQTAEQDMQIIDLSIF